MNAVKQKGMNLQKKLGCSLDIRKVSTFQREVCTDFNGVGT